MKHFTSVNDVKDLGGLIRLAGDLKKNETGFRKMGKDKVLGLIFMNPSLRTRLSTQKAALNLGMEVMVMNFSGEGWALETQDGVVMEGDKPEHIKEAAAVVGRYCDIIGLRSFPLLKDREEDYEEIMLKSFLEYSGSPVISLESATRHPLQSLADLLTIEEYKKKDKPKVVLTWAPHPKALPQSVPNSFLEWAGKMEYELLVTHPEGYELSDEFTGNIPVEYDQAKALAEADFVYVKNWSSYKQYGQVLNRDKKWTLSMEKLLGTHEARVMHCLPVRRNMVISEEVLESHHSIVIEQAANRVWSAQAVLKEILENL